MRVAIASDHAGFAQKQALAAYLAEELDQDVIDLGPSTDDRVDYPDFAEKVACAVARDRADRGVLLCGTGIGVSIAADKVAGIRACSITTPEFAELFRRHNNGNVVCLSGRFIELAVNKEIVRVFMDTPFEGGRHAERVAKITRIDETGRHACGPQRGGAGA